MSLSLIQPFTALALVLATGLVPLKGAAPASPQERTRLRAQETERAILATQHLAQLRSGLGLTQNGAFTPHHVLTTPQGRTVVRLSQQHQGLRVWAGEAIAHVEADGGLRAFTAGVVKGITLADTTARLSPLEAKAIALRNLAPKGSLKAEPRVEKVIFPTRHMGGLATRFDSTRKSLVWDRDMSLPARIPIAEHVVAYEVKTLLMNPKDGHREINYIIDANTGSILRKWSALQGDAPAQGSGQSYFRGTVPLSTTQSEDGTFSLRSQERGSGVNPVFAQNGLSLTGLTTCHGLLDMNVGMLGFDFYAGSNTTNAWGNGQRMAFPWDFNYVPDPMDWSRWWGAMELDWSADGMAAWPKNARTPSGETDAVDCHYGLSATWDFYKNVFGRDGIDGKGTSTFGVVHYMQMGLDGIYPMADNAFWSPANFGMFFGDGTFGTPWAAQSYGLKTITELDITGHELTHGVTEYSAGLIYAGQSGGINEATSDILGKMVQAYTDGGATGASIPDFPTGDLGRWEIAKNCVPDELGPLRYMYKPSLDGISADGWFDGIDLLDVHFSSGPVNRFFYFLSCGASASSSSPIYSPYRPQGLQGIGNDKAAKIYYKALTEYMTPETDFEAARSATLAAAVELFGEGSPESIAVQKAWAAVNVGLAPGDSPRVRVTFPVINGEGSWLDGNAFPEGVLRRVQIFPTSTTVRISVNVENTANTNVSFSTPGWLGSRPAGTVRADGTWTTPNWNYYEDLLSVRASSQAAPEQFALTHVLLVNLDSDQDTEQDALDLGATAMGWYKPGSGFDTPQPSARVAGGGDWDIEFFVQAFQNGFPAQR